jgi:hypothetical protein
MRMELGMGAPMSTDAVLRDMPRPDRVTTPAQFLAALQALRAWAKLTYGELEINAQAYGDRLPRSTIASALSRGRIPREQTIAAFVRACGCDEKTVQHWLAARRKIAAADQAVGDLAGAVEKWVTTKWRARGGSDNRADRVVDDAELATDDLASEVETWLAGRGRIAVQVPRQRRGEDAESARARWADEAAARPHPFDEPLPDPTYGQGRLAEAVAQSTSNKWVGLHRRPARRRIFFSRG